MELSPKNRAIRTLKPRVFPSFITLLNRLVKLLCKYIRVVRRCQSPIPFLRFGHIWEVMSNLIDSDLTSQDAAPDTDLPLLLGAFYFSIRQCF
jgi:hypothetical protein